MSRNRRRRVEPWGIVAIGALVGFLPLVPLPFELIDSPKVAAFRMILIGPIWLSLGIGLVLRYNVARVAVQWLLSLQLVGRCVILLAFIERESLWTLGWFMIHAVASLGVLEFLRRSDVRVAFTGEEEGPAVVDLEPAAWRPDAQPDPTAIFRDPSRSDRYNDA